MEFPTATPVTFHLTPEAPSTGAGGPPSFSQLGALVCGRALFDFTDGWGGRRTMDVPVVVVSHDVPTEWVDAHPDAPCSFATAGVEAAVARAQEIAADRVVAVTAGTMTRQQFTSASAAPS
ncbi:MAG: Dihydrofolate reductase [Propionibacteriaceae bacterium]|nr:Dihydrofolate reductase [Propionibacteriaceae bacterium]